MAKKRLFFGVGTALVTPFETNGALDTDAFRRLVARNLEGGVDALVVCGTTGEASTLTDEEKDALVRITVESAGGSVPVIVGVGSNCTSHAESRARRAEQMGADGLLCVTPYYNKATDRGLVEHYRRIAASTSLPIIAYTVPSRTGMNISPHLWGELFAIPNIVGLKDATGDISYGGAFLSSLGGELSLWSGNDNATLPLLSLGADGVISVLSNLCPRECKTQFELFISGEHKRAATLASTLAPLTSTLFCEVNPVPIKAALSLLGLCTPYCRTPLSEAREDTFSRLSACLGALGITK